ncbi:CBU_0592 family membrane protein [Flavobacterium sp.]|uniref:CBU_0592 family membrane protein n=1 Tax=Flavobacterium sp. TaxID=239 RepID=UPI003F695939
MLILPIKMMSTIDIIGFIGVSILLIAFFLNITNKIEKESYLYLIMNFVGAALACLASILMNYLPFIILEGSWTLLSFIGIINKLNTKKEVNLK